MTDAVQFPGPAQPVGAPQALQAMPGPPAPGKDFKSILLDSLEQVNRLQHEADRGVERLLTGETDNVVEVITAVNKAEIAFDLLMEIRNKLTEAYRQIEQMQV